MFETIMIMKKIGIFFAAVTFSIGLVAQKQNPTYLAYIEEWKDVAIQNQADYGVPASIIMAQALLESAAGTSELATNARNHFGIKCTNDWFGGVYYYDDDSKGECFRQYANAAESFKDHSLFLQRPRYATCFEIAVEDYEGWAYQLKQCGYATDKNYAPKLIKLVEDYRLDTLVGGDIQNREKPAEEPKLVSTQRAQTPDKTKRPLKAEIVRKSEPIMVIHNDPEPPYVVPPTAKQERDSFFFSHPKKKVNGVQYVEAREGDTYANIAFRLNVRERQLREWNDALARDLKAGDRVFTSAKKKTVPKEKSLMWVHPGESLWVICQREGIQMAQVQKLNGFVPELRIFRTRQQIYLNKVKEQK